MATTLKWHIRDLSLHNKYLTNTSCFLPPSKTIWGCFIRHKSFHDERALHTMPRYLWCFQGGRVHSPRVAASLEVHIRARRSSMSCTFLMSRPGSMKVCWRAPPTEPIIPHDRNWVLHGLFGPSPRYLSYTMQRVTDSSCGAE